MPSIVTRELKIKNSEMSKLFFSDNSVYCYIGKDTVWTDEDVPDAPEDSIESKNLAFNDILAVKRVLDANIQYVIRRIDWVSSTIYDEYDHRTDLTLADFYVLTDDYNVYKCIFNNNGATSTIKPIGQSIYPFESADGYIWKFMYNLDVADVQTFLTPSWVPCDTLTSNNASMQWNVQESAVDGSIELIKLDDGGVGYDNLNPPVVTIVGDGTGATATAVVNVSGNITDIVIDAKGSDYSYAYITVVGIGTGGAGTPIISPKGGHGSDSKTELLATYMMIRIILENDEGGLFPITSYRKSGLLVNPRLNTGTAIELFVNDFSYYRVGDLITGETSGATGTIIAIDNLNSLVTLGTVTSSFIDAENISSDNANTSFVALIKGIRTVKPIATESVLNVSSLEPRTGDMVYMNTRTKVIRSINQSEELKFVVTL